MGRKKEKELVKHVTLEDLNKDQERRKISSCSWTIILIRFIYKGETIKDACDKVDISEPTGYSWLDSWNERGYEGLCPFFRCPKPNWETRAKWFETNDCRERCLDIKGSTRLVKQKFDVEYSEMQVWRMLTSWNMHHAKPYILDKNGQMMPK